jgi:tetratricopeptide (TPR) repeat protein
MTLFVKRTFVIICVFILSLPFLWSEPNQNEIQGYTDTFLNQLQEYLGQGNLQGALDFCDQVPTEYAGTYTISFIHSSLLFSAGQYTEADKIGSVLLSNYPTDVDVLYLNSMIAKMLNNGSRRNTLLKQILEIDPANPDANGEFGNDSLLEKNYNQAYMYFAKGLSKNPYHIDCLFGYGQAAYYLNKLTDSKKAFKSILNINPENAMAWSYLGKVEAETEQYIVAIECALKALELEPKYYNYWIEYGNYLRFTNKNEEAKQAYGKAIEIDPSYFLAYVYRAGLYDADDKRAEALADYQQAIRCNPDYYLAYEAIGIFAWGEGKWEESRKAFEKAYEINSSNVSYPLMISACYQKENKKQDNKLFMSKVIKTMDKKSLNYAVARMYMEGIGDGPALQKVVNETNKTTKGKMLFYMALFYELKGNDVLANKYYIEVQEMKSPMFFEYRLNDWALENKTK